MVGKGHGLRGKVSVSSEESVDVSEEVSPRSETDQTRFGFARNSPNRRLLLLAPPVLLLEHPKNVPSPRPCCWLASSISSE